MGFKFNREFHALKIKTSYIYHAWFWQKIS